MRTAIVPAGLVLVLSLVGCAGEAADDPTDAGPTVTPGESAGPDALPSLPVGEVPSDALEEIVLDAAARAGVAAEEVRILSAESVTWSDGSLGCPEPGMMYTQALVPGYRIVAVVDGEELSYHAAETGGFRFCADPQPPVNGAVDR